MERGGKKVAREGGARRKKKMEKDIKLTIEREREGGGENGRMGERKRGRHDYQDSSKLFTRL